MTEPSSDRLTVFPPFDSVDRGPNKHDSVFDLTFDPHQATDYGTMAGSPFIKPEPNDFGTFDNTFMSYSNGQQQHPFNSNNGNHMNINPASLSNGSNMSQSFGQSNMTSSFNMGNAAIADDELLDLELNHGQQTNNNNNNLDYGQGMQSFFPPQPSIQQAAFSHTPDAPINSPFSGSNNMAAFRQFGGHSMPQQIGAYRTHMHRLDRKVSDSRSPATPNTPAMSHMQIGDDFPHPGMQQVRHQRQQSSIGGGAGWDSTPSGHSWNDNSPFPSPSGHPVHTQISEVLKSNDSNSINGAQHHKVASSLPTKMEGSAVAPVPGLQSQEAKRRRRRESHNLVERRRRDNINERIQDLGGLVPQHRLEDEKVRKHLQSNAPLSPSISNATGMSPPAATSLLAGSQGRRAAGSGSITQGLPIEDKDKGPNKGDILNGSVAWTRDLMWYTYMKLQQEQELKDYVASLGGVWPFEQNEEERRMHSEICEILNKHAPHGGFPGYSRAPGSGLRVPGFTNVAGDHVNGGENHPTSGFSNINYPQQATSPGFQSGGSGMSSGQMAHQQQFWSGGDFKEEDEYGMDELQ